jgi:hypothetical protein
MRSVNPALEILEVSSQANAGIDAWIGLIEEAPRQGIATRRFALMVVQR